MEFGLQFGQEAKQRKLRPFAFEKFDNFIQQTKKLYKIIMSSAKIVILGIGGVGKSALTLQFFSSTFIDTYEPTLEDSYRKTIEVDDNPIVLNIYDTAGQEEFYSIRDQYIRIGEAFVFVYSITNKSSLDRVKDLRDRVVYLTEENKQVAVLFGNKTDLDADREVTAEMGQEIAGEYGWLFFEGSAKYKTNVMPAFAELVRFLRREQILSSPRQFIELENQNLPPSGRKRTRRTKLCIIL